MDESGTFTAATRAGEYRDAVRVVVDARGMAREASVAVTIKPGPLAAARIEPSTVTLGPTARQQFTASAFDAWQNPIGGVSVSWAGSPEAGAVDQTGIFIAGTKAGAYPQAVRVVISAQGASREATAAVTVKPGPLHQVTLEPPVATLQPDGTVQFSVAALDAWGNAVPQFNASWSADARAGSTLPTGRFTAGTKAGEYPGVVRILVEAAGVSREAAASVVIRPGPVSQAALVPPEAQLYTGDATVFTVTASDRYGNAIPTVSATWSPSELVDTTGKFTAGRQPGDFVVTALVTDGQATAPARGTARVQQGYCRTRVTKPVWDMAWYRLVDGPTGATFGEALGSAQQLGGPLKEFGWGYAAPFPGRPDYVALKATTTIVVQREGYVLFTVGGDDGFRLRVDGTEVANKWFDHTYVEVRSWVHLVPGIHRLELDYYERTGRAYLSFDADPDVFQWTEAEACYGGYAEPPPDRYFVLRTSGVTASALAERFNVPLDTVPPVSTGGGIIVVPGGASRSISPTVIVLGGINSSSGCQNPTTIGWEDGFATRLMNMTRAAQLWDLKTRNHVPVVDARDFVGFSYSGIYIACEASRPPGVTIPEWNMYTDESYPAYRGTTGGPPSQPEFGAVLPVYGPRDTCAGVAVAADRLDRLVRRVAEERPHAPIVLVGHSMGGMVVTYYLSMKATPVLQDRIRAVVTLDSPLLGFPDAALAPSAGACETFGALSWRDVMGQTPVVSAIRALTTATMVSRLYALTATIVGQVVPGTPVSNIFRAGCAKAGTLVGFLLGVLLTLLTEGLGAPAFLLAPILGFIDGHDCAFYDGESLQWIAGIVNANVVSRGSPAVPPTPQPGQVAVIRFAIDANDTTIAPRSVDIVAGRTYRVEFTNNGKRAHAFSAQRWQIDLFAPAGQSVTSDPFSESIPGAYPCHDRFDAARNPDVKCTIVVQPAPPGPLTQGVAPS